MVISIVKRVLCYTLTMAVDREREIVSRAITLLKQERERAGMSMNALAEKSGLSQSMVSLVERDLRNPTLDTLLRIARALDVDLAKLLAKASRGVKRS
jgi:transcriptional regulator with XRE-family HTH domain